MKKINQISYDNGKKVLLLITGDYYDNMLRFSLLRMIPLLMKIFLNKRVQKHIYPYMYPYILEKEEHGGEIYLSLVVPKYDINSDLYVGRPVHRLIKIKKVSRFWWIMAGL